MNTMWSTYVQRIGTLDQSRSLRFSDLFEKKYRRAFDIDGRQRMLEIGCGTGALCGALHRWYPDAEIVGTDRDSAFIAYAREKVPGVAFAEEDATRLSFPENSFDVTISNTVAEHIEPGAFFGEQYRVLRPGGVCLVLSVRKGINIAAPCVTQPDALEDAVWSRVEGRMTEARAAQKVCQYPMTEAELPRAMAQAGFRDISTEFLTINLTPDDPCYDRETAHAMIEADRRNDLDYLEILEATASDLVSRDELTALRALANARYDKRLALYDAGEKQWDVNMTLLMVLRGVK